MYKKYIIICLYILFDVFHFIYPGFLGFKLFSLWFYCVWLFYFDSNKKGATITSYKDV